MPPFSDGDEVRTVGCSLEKLIPDPSHLHKIRGAVAATHKATILASELLNMHIRRKLDADPTSDLGCCFSANWLLNAYNEVTVGKRKVKVDAELRATRDACMPPFFPPDRTGVTQCLLYDARNLATVATTGVWMHFHKRILSHVRRVFAFNEEMYNALSKDQKRHRKLELMQMASDLCRSPDTEYQSPATRHDWITSERTRLGIDKAVGEWKGKPLLYHLKAKPHRFLNCMRIMSMEKEVAGGKAFALYPIRRTNVPRHARFDQIAIRDLLGIGKSDFIKEKRKAELKKRKRDALEQHADNELTLPPLQPDGVGYESGHDDGGDGAAGSSSDSLPKLGRTRRTKDEMTEENAELFGGIVDLRAAGVHRRRRFDFAFTTDGVCARVQMRSKKKAGDGGLTSMPRRGIWAIDQLKHVARADEMLVVGVDPGKRELICAVNMDDPKNSPLVRYTQKQRLRHLRSRQYADEAQRGKPREVKDAEVSLAGFNSRTANIADFCAYCGKRHETLDECLAFYADLGHRKRRWKTVIKAQASEERLYKRLEGIKKKGDARPIVLAYGSWGMISGRAGAACNRGNPPCIGVGLMRKLSKRFVVSPTPEAYTSKTCCRCLGPCGPWEEKEAEMDKKIRGLRRCTQRDCMLPLNRDKNGATNIGTNFTRLMSDQPPIRSMTDEDLAFHRASLCMECE